MRTINKVAILFFTVDVAFELLGVRATADGMLRVTNEHDQNERRALDFGRCVDAETFQSVPFTASAYKACTFFKDQSKEKLGSCGDSDLALDGQSNEDPVCAARGGECHVAFTETNEFLEYTFFVDNHKNPHAVYNIIARVASEAPRDFLIEIDNNGDKIRKVLTAPGNGYFEFEDVIWERARFPQDGFERIYVEFIDGFTNFCSLRVEETTQIADKVLTIPFDSSAQTYTSFLEKSPKRFGTCGPGAVDSQPTNDLVCGERGGICNIGWTEVGEEVIYEVFNDENMPIQKDVILRLASNRRGRHVSVEIEGYPTEIRVIEAPGNGFQQFEDRSWTKANFGPGKNRLIVKFLDGKTNMCSVSVK